ncbi:hypothetical protein M422DRAFT_190421, partial [Sphaerobolus stellatus SS14]
MLPAPVYARTRPPRNRLGLRIYPNVNNRSHGGHLGLLENARFGLLARSKATIFLLSCVLAISVLFNLYFYTQGPLIDVQYKTAPSYFSYPKNLGIFLPSNPSKDEQRGIPPASINASHLIVVPGHAIWTGSDLEDVYDEDNWILEPYQKGHDGRSVKVFVEHIKAGVDLALKDSDSLLIFTGGHTRPSTPSSEGSSYHHLAQTLSLLPPSFNRATTESFALDSYQNFLFSIARFREVVGRYPANISVIGYGMKQRRFEELHRKAVGWKAENFHYVGIDEKGDTTAQYAGELQNGYAPFSTDLYGCHDFLLQKRLKRNPSRRFHPYHISAPEMGGL